MSDPRNTDHSEPRVLSNRDLVRFFIGLIIFGICFYFVTYGVAIVARALH